MWIVQNDTPGRQYNCKNVSLHMGNILEVQIKDDKDLYVNNFSVSLAQEGRKAVEMVFEKASRDRGSIFVER